MIKLTRPPKPEILSSPKVMRLKENLLDQFNAGTQERMKFDPKYYMEVRPALSGMSRGKCAYCESLVGTTSSLEIDHYRPKSGAMGVDRNYSRNHYFWLAYEWENMLPCCQICGRNKHNLFPLKYDDKRSEIGVTGSILSLEEPLLLDPCFDEPSQHLRFLANGTVDPLTARGAATIEILQLNRELLRYARRDNIKSFTIRLDAGSVNVSEIEELMSFGAIQEHAGALRDAYDEWQKRMLTSDITKSSNSRAFSTISVTKDAVPKENFNTPFFQDIKRFSLKRIEISNFRTIRKLELDILPTATDEEQESWLLLLGDNGVGKSSILQAIAMTLCGEKQFKKLKLDASDYLRNGTRSGYIKIWSFEDSNPVVLEFDNNEFKATLKKPVSYLMGYGATRLLPRGDLKYTKHTEPLVNVNNLFDYSYPLNEVNDWLSKLSKEDFETRVAPALFDLLDLKSGERVLRSTKGRLEVQYSSGLRDFEKTSDGYVSITALACDIMKTLSEYPGGYHMANAIVLIDEIGNHLHPRWRMKICIALRKTFPKIQFIVSTHEPLCLRGLLKGEVAVLAADNKREVFKIDSTMLPDHTLMRVDELLTSDFFGLINLFDPETQEKFDEYYRLLSIPMDRRNDEEVNQIKIYTRYFARKEMVGSTPRVQAVYEIVNEKLSKKLLENDFRTKEQLKQETIDEVRNMLDIDSLTWL